MTSPSEYRSISIAPLGHRASVLGKELTPTEVDGGCEASIKPSLEGVPPRPLLVLNVQKRLAVIVIAFSYRGWKPFTEELAGTGAAIWDSS